jgi:hypothetical protein
MRMEPEPDHEQGTEGGEDWIAGATLEAQIQPFELDRVQLALNDLDVPPPDQWGDSGTAYA